MKKKKTLKHKKLSLVTYYVGNLLVGISCAVFLVILLPLARAYFFPQSFVHAIPHQAFYISIPKINAQAPIIEQVDPLNESVYRTALKKGIAHAKSTALPGEKGTVYLFAHSSGMPWEQTWYNTIFLRLNELQPGDKVLVWRNGKEFTYTVYDKKIVWPTEIQYLQFHSTHDLILQTCYPIMTSFRRLLVFARQTPSL